MPIKQHSRIWMFVAILMSIVAACLLIALIAVAVKDASSDDSASSQASSGSETTCGTQRSYNKNTLKLDESPNPGPFHDLTKAEIESVRLFLETTGDYPLYKAGREELSQLFGKAAIVTMDLLIPPKAEVLAYLDENAAQPPRQARVVLMRLDTDPNTVEEIICSPLPDVTSCTRMVTTTRRNPVEISFMPITLLDYYGIFLAIVPQVEEKLGSILKESFGTTFTDCGDSGVCLDFLYLIVPSSAYGDTTHRNFWMSLVYKMENKYLRVVDMSIQVLQAAGEAQTVGSIWYAGVRYASMDDLVAAYGQDSSPKVRQSVPGPSTGHFSVFNVRGEDLSDGPLRPPTLVEPDGKRFSVNHRQVTYLGWQYDFRLSMLTGPAIYDVRYKGERIAYELALQELAVFYSGPTEVHSTYDFVDSGAILGIYAKTLVPGADCPSTAVFVGNTFATMFGDKPVEFPRTFCIFEQNDGIPLVRHHDYSDMKYYNGFLDSYLTLRTILAIGNYDYIVDFMFHQNGVINTRVSSAGYIMSSYWHDDSGPYGHQIAQNVLGNIHQHLFHFKVDVDIQGTSNRYETLDLMRSPIKLPSFNDRTYRQVKMEPELKKSEMDAVYKYNFNTPKYHVVHNNASRTRFGEIRAYRLAVNGMSKQLLSKGDGAEKSVPWARQQIVLTKRKEDERESSSPYAMWDSQKPVTDFSTFYEDDDNIVDEDLVFWVTLGIHHIPHTEDLPTTSTTSTRLSFSLIPHNYFSECPSVSSRDATRLQPWNPTMPESGVAVVTYGKAESQCITAKSELKKEAKDEPNSFFQMTGDIGVL